MFNILTKVDKSAQTRRNLHTHTHTHTHTSNSLLSPKQIGTICFAISILFSAPLFATDIPSSASTANCRNDPLETYSGTSNLQADWQANTIELHWYNGDTEIQNVPSESQSCTYDGTLTPPATIPTKTGYTFKGWRVKPDPTCGMSHLDPDIGTDWDETHTRWKSVDPTNALTMEDEFGTENSGDLNNGEWAVTFSYGTVKGMAKCSNTNGTWATVGNPSNTIGSYCWCAATEYTPDGGTQCNVASPSWVFLSDDDFGGENYCVPGCPYECAMRVSNYPYSDFRRVVFGVSQ